MKRLLGVLDRYLVPVVLTLTYLAFVVTAEMAALPALVTLFVFAFVLLLWSVFRELRIHADASRLAANGEPEALLALADRELGRRILAKSAVPFFIYRSLAYQLRGDWAAAEQALAETRLDKLGSKTRRLWALLHAEQRVSLLARAGDAAAARVVLEGVMAEYLRFVPGAGAQVIGREAEARVLFAEGKLDDARTSFEALAMDIRLGPAIRAQCHHFIARCVQASDPVAARAAFAEAARLAPKTWMGAAAAADQKLPSTASPTPSPET